MNLYAVPGLRIGRVECLKPLRNNGLRHEGTGNPEVGTVRLQWSPHRFLRRIGSG
jgi:hypothetical protein